LSNCNGQVHLCTFFACSFGALIPVVARQVDVVVDLHDLTIAVADTHPTILVDLLVEHSVVRGVHEQAPLLETSGYHARIIGRRTIGRLHARDVRLAGRRFRSQPAPCSVDHYEHGKGRKTDCARMTHDAPTHAWLCQCLHSNPHRNGRLYRSLSLFCNLFARKITPRWTKRCLARARHCCIVRLLLPSPLFTTDEYFER
jgi:hypothetical protein